MRTLLPCRSGSSTTGTPTDDPSEDLLAPAPACHMINDPTAKATPPSTVTKEHSRQWIGCINITPGAGLLWRLGGTRMYL
jgi:hypothetical protein